MIDETSVCYGRDPAYLKGIKKSCGCLKETSGSLLVRDERHYHVQSFEGPMGLRKFSIKAAERGFVEVADRHLALEEKESGMMRRG
jgi:hypothetical protein